MSPASAGCKAKARANGQSVRICTKTATRSAAWDKQISSKKPNRMCKHPVRYSFVLCFFSACGSDVGQRKIAYGILPEKVRKTARFQKKTGCFGAAGQIRTADLILTKDALYLLSYSSIWRPRWGSNPRPPA